MLKTFITCLLIAVGVTIINSIINPTNTPAEQLVACCVAAALLATPIVRRIPVAPLDEAPIEFETITEDEYREAMQ